MNCPNKCHGSLILILTIIEQSNTIYYKDREMHNGMIFGGFPTFLGSVCTFVFIFDTADIPYYFYYV